MSPPSPSSSQQPLVPTQLSTQPTPSPMALQNQMVPTSPETWGFLIPTKPNYSLHPVELCCPGIGEKHCIGRAKKRNHTRVDHKSISNWHCDIWRMPNNNNKANEANGAITWLYWLEDKSTNGTWVRESKVGKGNRTILNHGDEIRMGSPRSAIAYYFALPPGSAPTHEVPRKAYCEGIENKYEFLGMLGEGAFATVLKALRRSDGQFFAVKCIQKQKFARDQKQVEMFKKEIEIQESIRHEYVIQLHETFEDDDDLCLVLEFINGCDLLNYVLERQHLSEIETLNIARMVFPAIAHFHRQGITHRDLKPENIMITYGNDAVAKIADFGLAKFVHAGTELRTQCGTLQYLAPEVMFQRYGPYTNKVDAYAMGLIMYCCITGAAALPQKRDDQSHEEWIDGANLDWGALPQNVSNECLDFVNRLSRKLVDDRMSIEEALNHPWLLGSEFESQEAMSQSQQASLPFNPSQSRYFDIQSWGAGDSPNGQDDAEIEGEGTSGPPSPRLGAMQNFDDSKTDSTNDTPVPGQFMPTPKVDGTVLPQINGHPNYRTYSTSSQQSSSLVDPHGVLLPPPPNSSGESTSGFGRHLNHNPTGLSSMERMDIGARANGNKKAQPNGNNPLKPGESIPFMMTPPSVNDDDVEMASASVLKRKGAPSDDSSGPPSPVEAPQRQNKRKQPQAQEPPPSSGTRRSTRAATVASTAKTTTSPKKKAARGPAAGVANEGRTPDGNSPGFAKGKATRNAKAARVS